MTKPLTLTPQVATAAPSALRAVDRAVAELRRGGLALLVAEDGAAGLVLAAEAVTPVALAQMTQIAGARPLLAITGRRAAVLGLLPRGDDPAVTLTLSEAIDAAQIHALADPQETAQADPAFAKAAIAVAEARCCAGAAVQLAKLARLLPAALMAPLAPGRDLAGFAARHDLLLVAVADILAYPEHSAKSLRAVSEARVPLDQAFETRVIAFRPGDGGIEHLAIVIGEPDGDKPVLVRLHSECFTGDLLGSLRCDCGDQLRGAIGEIAKEGSGVLLYLAQEGRGIGLVNKLRTYQLQDDGFDTLDANGQLGFDDDERVYSPAAEMLRQLGIGRVRLLTNNPSKVEALAGHGIQVSERVPHVFPANGHNEFYLRTKATKGGHLF
ncbi:MAG: GTP cyclohydrolase II [Rhodospirillales bacterium]|nr:GTP cyclohydrolase II [Rhodospirillales bacterium]